MATTNGTCSKCRGSLSIEEPGVVAKNQFTGQSNPVHKRCAYSLNAKFGGFCKHCKTRYNNGESIVYDETCQSWVHKDCAPSTPRAGQPQYNHAPLGQYNSAGPSQPPPGMQYGGAGPGTGPGQHEPFPQAATMQSPVQPYVAPQHHMGSGAMSMGMGMPPAPQQQAPAQHSISPAQQQYTVQVVQPHFGGSQGANQQYNGGNQQYNGGNQQYNGGIQQQQQQQQTHFIDLSQEDDVAPYQGSQQGMQQGSIQGSQHRQHHVPQHNQHHASQHGSQQVQQGGATIPFYDESRGQAQWQAQAGSQQQQDLNQPHNHWQAQSQQQNHWQAQAGSQQQQGQSQQQNHWQAQQYQPAPQQQVYQPPEAGPSTPPPMRAPGSQPTPGSQQQQDPRSGGMLGKRIPSDRDLQGSQGQLQPGAGGSATASPAAVPAGVKAQQHITVTVTRFHPEVAIVVTGRTYDIKEGLKGLGFRWVWCDTAGG